MYTKVHLDTERVIKRLPVENFSFVWNVRPDVTEVMIFGSPTLVHLFDVGFLQNRAPRNSEEEEGKHMSE